MAKVDSITSKHQATQEYSSEDREKVADVHCHQYKHAVEGLAFLQHRKQSD